MNKYTMIAMMGFVMLSLTASAQCKDKMYKKAGANYGITTSTSKVTSVGEVLEVGPGRTWQKTGDTVVETITGYECIDGDYKKIKRTYVKTAKDYFPRVSTQILADAGDCPEVKFESAGFGGIK